jgi:hypothetical protein
MSSDDQTPDLDARVRNDYVPVHFLSGWLRERYLGWTNLHDSPGLRVSVIRRGPVTKHLVLARKVSSSEVAQTLRKLGAFRPLSTIAYHDFSADADAPAPTLAGHRFHASTSAERCVNSATFVLDLHLGIDALWKRLRSRARGAWRKAEGAGTTVAFTRTPSRKDVDLFFDTYERMARDRGLARIDRGPVDRMFHDGRLVLAHGRDRDGRSLVLNLTYVTGDTAFYLYGASGARNGGEGQFVQAETIKYLVNEGLRWYDCGGVPSIDPRDGIFLFKESLGGTLVHLGQEYVYSPWPVTAVVETARRAKQIKARIQGHLTP